MIGARIKKDVLEECKKVINNHKNPGIFGLDLDSFLKKTPEEKDSLTDLGSIIQNNWELFSPYFPDMPWIMSKVSEFSKCRNLVAHNSYLKKHEKDVVRVNYTSILKQLNETLKLGQ